MKIRHILLNILPLPLWIAYYLLTISDKDLVMMPTDEDAVLIIIIAFTVYNLFSRKATEFLIKNLIATASLTAGLLIGGQVYLKFNYHMSDEHYSAVAVPLDIAACALLITGAVWLIFFIFTRIRKKTL